MWHVCKLPHIVSIVCSKIRFGDFLKKELLDGKTALITGANRGIGLAVATLFAAHGAKIIACVRNPGPDISESIAKLASVNVNRIRVLKLDLEDIDSIKEVSSILIAEGKKLDILVNNSGFATGSRYQLISRENLQRSLQVNYIGPLLLTQRLIKILCKDDASRSSSVVNVSSSAVNFPNVGMSAYSSSKAAMEQSSKVLAKELATSNIRINVLSPGPVETDMLLLMNNESRNNLIDSTWMRRPAKAQEIASVALFLASDLSSYITGQVIHVNGGLG